MTYSVVWRPEPVAALRELRRHDPATAKALTALAAALANDPRPTGSRALGSGQFRRVKLEDLRVLYEVNDRTVTIFIIKIGSI
jgi:mRNA interferase RelE/StbE